MRVDALVKKNARTLQSVLRTMRVCPDSGVTFCDAFGMCALGIPECEESPVDLCEDFIPPCKKNGECPAGMVCSLRRCNPSFASCDPLTGDRGDQGLRWGDVHRCT